MMQFNAKGLCVSGHGTSKNPTLYKEENMEDVHLMLKHPNVKLYNGDWKKLLPKNPFYYQVSL